MRSIIFDMDGVLIDSEPIHARLVSEVAGRYGMTISEREALQFVGIANRDMWRSICGSAGRAEQAEEILAEHEALTRDYFSAADLAPIPGIPELLDAFKHRGFALGVASSSESALIRSILRGLGLGEYFSALVGGDQVDWGKPDPEIYLRALELLGGTAAESAAVDDSTAGIRAALAAGLRCVGFSNKVDDHGDSPPQLRVEGFDEESRRSILDFVVS